MMHDVCCVRANNLALVSGHYYYIVKLYVFYAITPADSWFLSIISELADVKTFWNETCSSIYSMSALAFIGLSNSETADAPHRNILFRRKMKNCLCK